MLYFSSYHKKSYTCSVKNIFIRIKDYSLPKYLKGFEGERGTNQLCVDRNPVLFGHTYLRANDLKCKKKLY